MRFLEPLTSLALAGHAMAVQTSAHQGWDLLITCAALVLLALGVSGLLGARSTRAVIVRGLAVLVLGFVLQGVGDNTSEYFLLWFFVLVSVYPLVLPPAAGRLVAFVTPGAYLALLPVESAVDGSGWIALLRALSLALMGGFVHRAANAYRDTANQVARSEAAAQDALSTLQQALLPAEVTSPPGVTVAVRYRAAGIFDKIGGDWYDTVDLPGGGLALVIGDVEGHDLTAASVMGLVRGAVRSYALEGHPPSIVMERVNTFLTSARIDRLVTMAYVQLYPDDTIATVAVAGHPVPLVVPGNGLGTLALAAGPGPVLGIAAEGQWDERTVLLPKDASLVLYTDGLTGFPRAPVDQLDRLIDLVRPVASGPAQLIADTLIAAAPSYDDAAVLVAQVRSTYLPPAQRTFPAQPISASIARTWIADLFDLWQASGVIDPGPETDEKLEAAQLMLTELVSNAVRHSDQSVWVRIETVGQRLRVEVADTSERMPVMRRSEVAATEGRGLRLVDALSSGNWGARLDGRGKIVWFELDLDADGCAFDEEKLLNAFAEPEPR